MNVAEIARKLFEPFASKTAGNAVAVVWNHEVVYQHVGGHAHAAQGIPVTPDTPFCIGSITKTMTALHVMQQVQAGKLGLDDPIMKHLKRVQVEQPYINNPIRVRHLMTHTSGLGYLRTLTDLFSPTGKLGTDGPVPSLPEYYQKGLSPVYPPETKWSYSNHGYALLGQLVEDVTGEPFETSFTRDVLRAAGMEKASLLRPSQRAYPHVQSRKGYQVGPDFDVVVRPAGSVYASLQDMLQYVWAVNNHSPVLLDPEGFEQMMSPQVQVAPGLPAMGLGFLLQPFGTHSTAMHTGGWLGFNSCLHVCPELGLGVVVMSNSVSAAVVDLPQQFLTEVLGPPGQPAQVPVAQHYQFARHYGEPARGTDRVMTFLTQQGGLTVKQKGDQLFLHSRFGSWFRGVPLKPLGNHLFEVQDPELRLLCAFEVQGNRVTAISMGMSRLLGRF